MRSDKAFHSLALGHPGETLYGKTDKGASLGGYQEKMTSKGQEIVLTTEKLHHV
jgi:hypothetical protein